MATTKTIKLYDMQLATGCTISPYVWRTKLALLHKGFEIDIVPGGFTGILERTEGHSDRLPVIVDDGHWVLDSAAIADYLDEKYPDRPLLFPNPASKPIMRFVETWIWRTVLEAWFTCYIADYHDLSMPHDQGYVRETREKFVGGQRLEDAQAGREDRLPAALPSFEPLRNLLHETPWLGGAQPDYLDYSALGIFLWAASIAKTPPFTDDEPLRDWLDRGFDLFGGVGRQPGMHSLFGLKLRPGDPKPFADQPTGQNLAPPNDGPGRPVEPR